MTESYKHPDAIVGCSDCPFRNNGGLCVSEPCPTYRTLEQAVEIAQESSTTSTEQAPLASCVEGPLPEMCDFEPQPAEDVVNRDYINAQLEADPDGVDPKAGGAKLDAGKAPIFQGMVAYFPLAMAAIAELSARGAAKYKWNGWESVPDGFNRYKNGAGRHNCDLGTGEQYDEKPGGTGVHHQTAVAWNEIAALELLLRELQEEGKPFALPVPPKEAS